MITAVSKSISLFLWKNHIIEEEEIEICQYGFEIIVSTILGTLIVLCIGLLLHMPWLAALYFIIFVVLRQMTGGYHAGTYFKCNLTFGILSFLVLEMTKILSQEMQIPFQIHVLILYFSVLVIAFYAPVENPNKPLDEKQITRNHIGSLVLSLLLAGVSLACFRMYPDISVLIGLTLFLVAMLILIVIMQRKEETP